MILGIISDIHANIVALDAVLKQLEEEGAQAVLCLGDLVGYGPSPNDVIERIRNETIMCTLGAADEKIAFEFARTDERRQGVADETIEWTRTVIDPSHVDFLRNLPAHSRLTTPQGRLRYFHGTLRTPSEKLNLNQSTPKLMKILEEARCNILACGNTHVPVVKRTPSGWIINPGSVGLSLNGEPGADYALAKIDDENVEVKTGKVEYDFAAVAFDIIAWGLPSMVAEAVQHGRMPQDRRGK